MTNLENYKIAGDFYYLDSADGDYWLLGTIESSNLSKLDFTEILTGATNIYITKDAFKDCQIKSITFDSRVVLVEEDAFAGCPLTTITFTDGVYPELQKGCFRSGAVDTLEAINNMFFVPGTPNTFLGHIFGASSAADNAQYVPTSLKTITVQTDLTPKCFADCKFIKKVTWSAASEFSIPFEAFYGCARLDTVYSETATAKDNLWTKEELEENKEITELDEVTQRRGIIDLSGVTYVGDNAFRGCYTFHTVFVPFSTIYFGTDCFRDCYGLVRVYNGTANSDLPRYIEKNSTDYGCIGLYAHKIEERDSGTFTYKNTYRRQVEALDETGTTLNINSEKYLVYVDTDVTNLSTEGINYINAGLCYGSSLTNLSLSSNLKHIGDFAFSNCSKLNVITNNSSALETVGKGCFKNCSALTKIVSDTKAWGKIKFGWPQYVYENITEFHTGSKIITLKFKDENTTTSTWLCDLDSTKEVNQVNLMSHAHFFDTIELHADSDTICEIPPRTFYDCYTLKEIKVNNINISSIGKDAFFNCLLTYEIIEDENISKGICGVKRIGNWVFGPSKDDSNFDDTFKGCKTCYIDMSQPVHFYDDAFKNCSTLENIVLIGPDKNTCINNWFLSAFNTIYSNPLYTEEEDKSKKLYIGSAESNNEITEISFETSQDIKYISSFAGSGLCLDSFTFLNADEDNLCKQIDPNAFIKCRIKEVTCLPSMVKSFNNLALEKITIVPYTASNDKQDNTIAYDALKNCSNLKTVIFSTPTGKLSSSLYLGIQKIGADAFYGCNNIERIKFNGVFSSPQINEVAWSNINFENQYSNPMCSASQPALIMTKKIDDSDTPAAAKNTEERISDSSYIYYHNNTVKPFVCLNLVKLSGFRMTANMTYIDPKGFAGCINLNNVHAARPNNNTTYWTIRKWSTVQDSGGNTKFSDILGSYIIRKSDNTLIYGTKGKYIIDNLDSTTIREGQLVTDNYLVSADTKIPMAIAPDAFYMCTGLTDMVIPNSVQAIGLGAFYGCTNIKNLSIPFLGRTSDYDETCGHLGYIFGAAYYNSTDSFVDAAVLPKDMTLTLTGDNINLVPNAFYGCKDTIKKLYISGQIQKADGEPLQYLTNLEYDKINDIFYIMNSADQNECTPVVLVKYTGADNTDFDLSNIQYIYSKAFMGNINLETITGLDNVCVIGDYAFASCAKLKKINDNDNKLCTHYIGDYAFKDTSIDLLELSETKAVGLRICQDCINLKTLSLPNTLLAENTRAEAFAGIPELHHVAMPAWLSSYFGKDSKDRLRSVTITAGTEIKPGAFSRCAWLRKIDFTENANITSIGAQAFMNCISLNQFNWEKIQYTCTSIGAQAFKDCWNLYKVIIPEPILKGVGTTKEYTKWLKKPYKTAKELLSSENNQGLETDAFRYCIETGNAAIKLRFLSNKFWVRLYTLVKNKLEQVPSTSGANDVYSLKANTTYILSFLPYAKFTRVEVGTRIKKLDENNDPVVPVEYIDAKDITREIDLFIQQEDSDGIWQDLDLTSKPSPLTASFSLDSLTFIATPDTETLSDYKYDYSGFSYNPEYKDGSIPGEDPYSYDGYYKDVEVTGYQLVTSIGKDAFANCYKLYSVDGFGDLSQDNKDSSGIGNNIKEVIIEVAADNTNSSNVFIYFKHPESDDLDYSGKIELLNYICENGNDIPTITIPNNINIISRYTFANQDSLTSVALPTQLDRICTRAFYSCEELSTISGSVTVIETDAFEKCPKLILK